MKRFNRELSTNSGYENDNNMSIAEEDAYDAAVDTGKKNPTFHSELIRRLEEMDNALKHLEDGLNYIISVFTETSKKFNKDELAYNIV